MARIAVWSVPRHEVGEAQQLVGRTMQKYFVGGTVCVEGTVTKAHADGTLWVDLHFEEGDYEENMTAQMVREALVGLPPPRLQRETAGRWRTGQVQSVRDGYPSDGPCSIVKYDDGTELQVGHYLRHEKWEPFQPTRNFKPECPECAVKMKTCRGDGSANAAGKNPRYLWVCPACETTATTQNPCLFNRTDPLTEFGLSMASKR